MDSEVDATLVMATMAARAWTTEGCTLAMNKLNAWKTYHHTCESRICNPCNDPCMVCRQCPPSQYRSNQIWHNECTWSHALWSQGSSWVHSYDQFSEQSISIKRESNKMETYDSSSPNALAFSVLGQHYILYFPIRIGIGIFFFQYNIGFGRLHFFLCLLLSMLFSLALSLQLERTDLNGKALIHTLSIAPKLILLW
jgi:hypothetical protein